jgi:hypothetical protein
MDPAELSNTLADARELLSDESIRAGPSSGQHARIVKGCARLQLNRVLLSYVHTNLFYSSYSNQTRASLTTSC